MLWNPICCRSPYQADWDSARDIGFRHLAASATSTMGPAVEFGTLPMLQETLVNYFQSFSFCSGMLAPEPCLNAETLNSNEALY